MTEVGDIVKQGVDLLKEDGTKREPVFIGNGTKLSEPPSKYHVHFGAGKLGLGLVVPTFKEKQMAIIQRPSNEWEQVRGIEKVNISVNKKKYASYYVIHQEDKHFGEKLNNLWSSGKQFIICTDNFDTITQVLGGAESISTSLGPHLKDIQDLFIGFKGAKEDLNLYPFENDTRIVEDLTTETTENGSSVKIVPVIADKICHKRTFIEAGINIEAEDFEEVYVLAINDEVQDTFRGTNINLIRGKDEFVFFKRRKLYLVNGIHMIAAIFGYGYLMERRIPISDWPTYQLSVMMGIKGIYDKILLFNRLQSLRLFIETDKNVLGKVFETSDELVIYQELLSYGQSIIERFDYSLDQLERILNYSDPIQLGAKLKERIQKIIDFTRVEKEGIIASVDKAGQSDYPSLLEAIIDLQTNVTNLLVEISENPQNNNKL